MGRARNVGRATVRRHLGRARVGRAIGKAPTPDRARTDVLKVGGEPPPPVFVDTTGRRRRGLRRLAYGLGAALLLVLLVLWLTQLGGAVRPEPAAPCPSATAAAGCR